jgi:hypothetical protein
VVDAAGAPVEGAYLSLYYAGAARPGEQAQGDFVVAVTDTDKQGAWKMPGIPKTGEPLLLRVRHSGHLMLQEKLGTGGAPTVEELFGQHSKITLAAPLSQKGTVLAAGKPVRGAKVFFFGPVWYCCREASGSGETDADGRFTLASRMRGPGLAVVVSKEHAPLCQMVEFSPDRPLALVLEEGRPLQGRLVDKQKNALANAHILLGHVRPPGEVNTVDLSDQPVVAGTDENGRFTWAHAPRLELRFDVLTVDGAKLSFEQDLTNQDFGTVVATDPITPADDDEDE